MQLASDLRVNYTPPPGGLPAGLTWLQGAGAPTDGVAGTGAGVAPKGSKYTDSATGIEYINQGTQASPEWHGVLNA
jgi:hypothetical protein